MKNMDINATSETIIGAAIEVHKHLGPGLMESAYEECLSQELSLRSLPYRRQVALPVEYKGIYLDCGYRMDLLVTEQIVVEIKAIDHLLPIHEAQLLTYLKLGGWQLGLLLNFNVALLKQGIRRIVNGLPEPSSKISAPSAPLR